MVVDRLKNCYGKSNQEIELKEQLNDCLTKAEALANVTLGEEFIDHPQSIVHGYLWALSDLISHARQLYDQLL
jgi:hypothetical protein